MKSQVAFFVKHILLIVGMLILSYDYAYAYIDPSTGSYIIQILIAGLLGAAFALKSYWQNIKNYFSKKSSDKDEDDE